MSPSLRLDRALRGAGSSHIRAAVHASLLAAASVLGAPSIHSQADGTDSGRGPDAALVVMRGWSPVAAVVMALPAPSGTHRDDLVARAYDRALLAAFRDATAGNPTHVNYDRDDTGRYFVALTDGAAAGSTLDTMKRVVQTGPALDLVDAAVAGIAADLAFRGDLPRTRFDRIMSAYLQGGTPDTVATAPAAPEGLAAEAHAIGASPPWDPPVWVVVGSRSALPASPGVSADPGTATIPDSVADAHDRSQPQPLYVARAASASPGPLRVEVPSDAVTRWVGSVYHFPPETTLVEAVMTRLSLEETLERLRDPNLYEMTTEIDVHGRLVVRFSTSADAGRRWDLRLDEAIAEMAAEAGGVRMTQVLRPARSRWSQEISAPAGAARAAARALLRGASDTQAQAFAGNAGEAPDAARISAIARGLTLSIRVVYGGN